MTDILWVGTDSGNEGDLNTAANYSPSGVPSNSDSLFFRQSSQDIAGSFTALSAVTLALLAFERSWTGFMNDGSGDDTEMEVGATLLEIGRHIGLGEPGGSQNILLNLGAVATTASIFHTSSSSSATYLEPVRIRGTNAGNKLFAYGGLVGIGTGAPGHAATFLEIHAAGGRVHCGDNVTLTGTAGILSVSSGGILVIQSAATAVRVDEDGAFESHGAGAITTVDINGGRAELSSTGTITNLNVGAGEADLETNDEPRTVTNCTLKPGAVLRASKNITFTNDIVLDNCGLEDVTLEVGKDVTIARS